MGGTSARMEIFAHYIMKEIGHSLPTGADLQDITRKSQRFAMYKVGPVLCVSVSTARFPKREIFLIFVLFHANSAYLIISHYNII